MSQPTVVAFALCVLCVSPAAFAHANADIGGFYQGMGTVFMHWDVLFLFVAGGLWTAQHPQSGQPALGTVLAFGFGGGFVLALVGARVTTPELVAGMAFAIAGLLTAIQLTQLPLSLCIGAAIAAMSGLSLGALELNTLQQPILFISGTLISAGMLMFYIVAAVSRLPAGWPRLGLRVAGSWIAAVGLIVCAYSWRALK